MHLRLDRHCESRQVGMKQSVHFNTKPLFIIFLFLAISLTLSNNFYPQNSYASESILIYSTTSNPAFPYARDRFDSLGAVLRNHGYAVTVTDRIVTPMITDSLLVNYNEFWIMSTYVPSVAQFSESEIQVILDFRNRGNGLFIDADHYTAGV